MESPTLPVTVCLLSSGFTKVIWMVFFAAGGGRRKVKVGAHSRRAGGESNKCVGSVSKGREASLRTSAA